MAKPKVSPADQTELFATRTTRVLIVDDHALVRDGLRLMFDQEPDLELCGEAADETEAVQVFRRAHPDVVIVDIGLKNGSGIEAIKRIKAHDLGARIIVASMHDERVYGERALQAGAMGFVSKQAPGGMLLTAIRQVMEGELFFSEQLTQRILRRAAGTSSPQSNSPVDQLADRELEAFGLIGQGLTTRQIASRMHISPKTVDRYRENIKRKLKLSTSNELIHHATLWVEQSR